jgi:UDP-N-acetylmuramoyl-L-alanyl-D-glutamate--2,6-diaminopimelate ligase
VTGTNGKSSVADFTRQIWQHAGVKAASLGTLGLVPKDEAAPSSLTTPDPVELHACLAALARNGVKRLALEASSHGLDQFRLDGVQVAAAAFTNLSRDHLDYHHEMDRYFAAKRRLFAELVESRGTAVLNADDPVFSELEEVARARGLRVMSYGRAGRNLVLRELEAAPEGLDMTFDLCGERRQVVLPLAGAFQAHNVLAALGLAIATDCDREAAFAALPGLLGVPGRMEHVGRTPSGGEIYVDYAHTPDALAAALQSARPHARGRLVVVFGCGGDRDPGKRPQMGAIASQLADVAIVTDDNPRGEEAAAIRRAILAAAPEAVEIGDRGEAIARAIVGLRDGDLLVIAGKGHEPGQIVGQQVLPFDDREVARAALDVLAEEAG